MICVIASLISLFTACSSSTALKTENGLKVVKVAFDDTTSEAGIILAEKLGYFEKQGIKIKYVKFTSGSNELTAVVSNQVDVSRGIINSGLFNAVRQDVEWICN